MVERCGRRPLFIGTFISLATCNVFIAILMQLSQNENVRSPQNVSFSLIAGNLGTLYRHRGRRHFPVFHVPRPQLSVALYHSRTRSATSEGSRLLVGLPLLQSLVSPRKLLKRRIRRGAYVAAYLPLKNVVGGAAAYAFLFVVPTIVAVPFYYFWLPETKNRFV